MKLTAWNAEWLDDDWGVITGMFTPGQKIGPGNKKAPTKADARKRVEAVGGFLRLLGADILFICEAPKGEDAMKDFVRNVTPDYDLITRQPADDYETQGRQWQWFLVRKTLADHISPELIPVSIWRRFAAEQSESINENGTWIVAAPRLRNVGGVKDVPVSERVEHRFFREPQILKFTSGGARHEIIGAHLKSKFTGKTPPKRLPSETFDKYLADHKTARQFVAKAHEARVKLTSEATTIRAYIDHRFSQEADPSILVVGDLNDGPGKELMEREYLLHDLISNLQGDVFFARKFLNHALFDFPQDLRWTSRFEDRIDPGRDERILLDHILSTQALTRSGTSPLLVKANAGKVEHLAFETGEAIFGKGLLSDHRPVSIELAVRTP